MNKINPVHTHSVALIGEIKGQMDRINAIDRKIVSCKERASRILSDNKELLELDHQVHRLIACIQEQQTYRDQPSSIAMAEKFDEKLKATYQPYATYLQLQKLIERRATSREWATDFDRKRDELEQEIAILAELCLVKKQEIDATGLPETFEEVAKQLDQIVADLCGYKEERARYIASLSNALLTEADAATAMDLRLRGSNSVDEWLESSLKAIDSKKLATDINSRMLIEIKNTVDACRRYPTLRIGRENGKKGCHFIVRYKIAGEPAGVRFLN